MRRRIITPKKELIVPQMFIPRWYQLEVLNAHSQGFKRFLLLWHRKTGKDLITLVKMFLSMMDRVGNYYYFFPSYAQGRKCLWEGKTQEGEYDGVKFLDRMPKELVKTVRNNEMYFELVNGSVLRVVGADSKKIDDIVGSGPVGIAMSEFGVNEGYGKVLDLMMPVLQQNGGWLMTNGTPRGKNHYYDLYSRVINMPDEWFVSSLQTMGPDFETGRFTGLISQEQIQLVRDQGTDEETIEQEYGVSFNAGVRGSIFGRNMAKALSEGRVTQITIDDHIWTETLWDLGNADYTSIWFIQRHGSKVIFIDYYQNNHQDWPHYVRVLENKGYRFRTHHLPHDGKQGYMLMPQFNPAVILRQCLKEAEIGGNVRVHLRPSGKEAKKKQIEACRRRFSQYYFDSGRCKEGIVLVERYHTRYDSVRKTFSSEVVHDLSSHCCDALMIETLTKHTDMYTLKQNQELERAGLMSKKSNSILNRFNRRV